MCRILYTVQHGSVISKPAVARWAQKTLGEPWSRLIEAALTRGRGEPFDHLGATLDFIRRTVAATSRRGRAAGSGP